MVRLRASLLPAAALVAALALLAAAWVAGGGEAPAPTPAARLLARVEAHLASPPAREALRRSLAHAALVFPVTQPELHAYLAPVRVLGVRGNRVLGTPQGLEPHGGGVLALLLRHWRPQGRAARLADVYPFQGGTAPVPLAELYASLRRQLFLPVPGRAPDAIGGALPATPQLARVRFDLRDAGVPWPPRDVDAYHALGLLAAHEPDPDRAWTNALGQRLSVRLLMEHAGGYYLAGADSPAEPEDHSELHLVELLLAAAEAGAPPPDAVKARFLRAELARREFDPGDRALLLGHHAESLGLLVADPRVRWRAAEREQVAAWLAWLEAGPFREVEGTDPRALAHLLRGLRLVERHAEGERLHASPRGAMPGAPR